MLVLAAIPCLLLVLAFALIVRGVRGRALDDHPLCRRCGFDLVGHATPATCPECGAGLTGPKAVLIGNRRARLWPLWSGVALLLLVLGVGTALSIAASRGYDFNKRMPNWMLELKAGGDGSSANNALMELSKRVAGGKVDEARLARLVEKGLAYQANAAAPWLVGWGDVMAAARAASAVTPEQWKSYGRHAYPVSTLVLPDLNGTSNIGVNVGPVRLGRGVPPMQGSFQIWEDRSVGGGSISFSRSSATVSIPGGGTMKILIQQAPLEFPKNGRLRINAKWHIRALSPGDDVIDDWIEEPPDIEVVQGGR